MDPFLILLAVVGVGAGAGVYGLTMRDHVRRGRLLRRKERLSAAGVALTLPDGRVPCPQCGEAIMPEARRCPYCRSVVIDRI
jgi:ribosomal protein L32